MDQISSVLEQLGMEPMGEELMYDGMTGRFIPSAIFVGNVYTMRLKHMPEDKWNARGEGRREQRTHQPTGGRGAQGGLRIGEMERDAIAGHGVTTFLRESMMQRSDGYQTWICNGCGTIPVYNEADKLFFCTTCDGPARFTGDDTMDSYKLMPAIKRSVVSFSKVEMPYAMKVLGQEMATYLNMGMRFLTAKDLKQMRPPAWAELTAEQQRVLLDAPLPTRSLPETVVPEYVKQVEEPEVRPEDLAALGAIEEDRAAREAEEEKMAASELAASSMAAEAPVPAMGGIVLQPANAAAPAAPLLGEDGSSGAGGEAAPGDEEVVAEGPPPPAAPANPGTPPPPAPGTVSVQTTTQPVLVVPVNVGTGQAQASGTQFIPPPVPGAPGTLAVDTGEAAMRNLGLPPAGAAAGPNNLRGGGGSSPRRGASPRRFQMPGGGPVSVNKLGSSGSSSGGGDSGAVRVTVSKMG